MGPPRPQEMSQPDCPQQTRQSVRRRLDTFHVFALVFFFFPNMMLLIFHIITLAVESPSPFPSHKSKDEPKK